MSERDRWLAETLNRLQYAQEDLYAAETMLGIESIPPRIICFHSQQAAEKVLKAVLVYENLDVPRTHDLTLIQSLLPEAWTMKHTLGDLTTLSIWAADARYPGDLPYGSHDYASNMVALASRVVTAVP